MILRNEAGGATPAARWLGVKLVGRENRNVVGSTVIVEGADRKWTRFVKGGGSYLSANDPRLLFGLGQVAKIKRITVAWSWGKTQSWEKLDTNQYWELKEDQSEPTPMRFEQR